MNTCKIVLFLSFMSIGYINAAIDFDSSMDAYSYPQIYNNLNNLSLLNLFKTLYEKNPPDTSAPSQDLKVPKIIHQIWLGGPLPEEYRAYRASWLRHHPDWIFIFWTDSTANYNQGMLLRDFDELTRYLECNNPPEKQLVIDVKDITFENKHFFDFAINYGEKSDILKWEIVYRFGGTYIDTDFECLSPLDSLHYMYDFYTGIQPLDTHLVQLGAALYGARPGHPILKQCVQGIKDNQMIQQIIMKTGPIHFTRSFLSAFNDNGFVNIALPASYFYPCSYEQRGLPQVTWRKPESIAVHHWAGSWLKPQAFVNYKGK